MYIIPIHIRDVALIINWWKFVNRKQQVLVILHLRNKHYLAQIETGNRIWEMCMAIWSLTKEVLVCGVVSVMETVRFDDSTHLFKIVKFAFK